MDEIKKPIPDLVDNSDQFGNVVPEVAKLKETIEVPPEPDYSKINLAIQGDRILLQDFPTAKKIGSIFTPEGREINLNRARVCGIGPDVKNDQLKLGDIIFKVYGLGQQLIDNNGDSYIFLPGNSVIAIDTDFKGGQDGE